MIINDIINTASKAADVQTQQEASETVTTSVKRSTKTTVSPTSNNRPSPRGRVCKAAKRMFGAQLDKNTTMKRRCLKYHINRHYGDDAPRFWLEMDKEAEKICDSKQFCQHCEGLKLDPKAVAEHLFVEGMTVVNRVLKEGFDFMGGTETLFDSALILAADLKSPTTQPRHKAIGQETT